MSYIFILAALLLDDLINNNNSLYFQRVTLVNQLRTACPRAVKYNNSHDITDTLFLTLGSFMLVHRIKKLYVRSTYIISISQRV